MNPSPRFPGLRFTTFVPRLVVWTCAWALLTEVAQAADVAHESFGEHLLHFVGLHLSTIMTALWVFVLGACIGSFLNVVIYRMPAGMALTHPGSRCPFCETELSARDNIPILGWLALRGRCRYCQVPISARYPLIESLVGLLFLILLLVETSTGGANLPFYHPSRVIGGLFDSIVHFGRWQLLVGFAYHATYLTLLLAVCMIGYDGHTPPRRLIQTGVLTGLIVGIVWPALRPVHAAESMPAAIRHVLAFEFIHPDLLQAGPLQLGPHLIGLTDGLCGLLSGLVTGWLATHTVSRNSSVAATLRSVLLLAGVFCGWQVTWPLLTVMLAGAIVLKLVPSDQASSGFLLILFGISSGFLFCWSALLSGIVLIRYDGWQWTDTTAWID